MKIKMLATGIAPDYFSIEGEVITAHVGEASETYDFSGMPEGATLTSVEPIEGINPIRHATRVDGELQVTLCQRVGAGRWTEGDWFDAADYDADKVYVKFEGTMAGTPVVYTREGKMTVEGV